MRTSALVQNLIIVAVAALLWLPCLAKGLPPNGDAYLHATYSSQFSRQFWSGEIYPRWMMTANKGYGSPIFLIQYPLPYWGTALLRPLVRFASTRNQETRELGIFCFLVLAAAGLNARFWLQRNHTPLAATAGAIVYVSLPHHLEFDNYSIFAFR